MKGLIFFETKIEPFKGGADIINPAPCTLKDNRRGWYLGEDLIVEILDKITKFERITKDDLIITEIE